MSESPRNRSPAAWPVRIYRLGAEPRDDLSAVTTAEQRLAMVAQLTVRMWELTGRPWPSYTRANIPVRILRVRDRRLG